MFLDARDRREVGAVRHVGAHLWERGTAAASRRRDGRVTARRTGQPREDLRVRRVRRRVRRAQPLLVETCRDDVGHHRHRLIEMVERDDVAREREDGISQTEVVVHGLRQPLDLADDVEPEVADRSTMQRDLSDGWRTQHGEQGLDRVEQPEARTDPIGEPARERPLDGD